VVLDAILTRQAEVIAWVSHHLPSEDGTLVGGAEMTDQKLLDLAPEPVKVIHSNSWREALDCEKIIITGTDQLSDEAMITLAKRRPVVSVHHKQSRSYERAQLISSASQFICHTPRHLEIELEWTSPQACDWVLSPHDPSDFKVGEKKNFALWAARWHEQKGPHQAIAWAKENDIELVMMHSAPREEVLQTMSKAKHFVFLPTDFDAEPRTLIESVLSGCIVHTNDLAGISSIPNWDKPDVMADLVSNAANRFWELALC
jgi:glycosyltransferase involved in cell wall biosynthesis